MAITWRNIETDTTRGAAALMEVARRSFNDGMGNFQGIVNGSNQVGQANWDQQKANNTSAVLDRLSQYKTPEELAAAQAAGELQAFKAQFGGQIDRDAVRDMEANQADVLMKRITTQNQYGDDTRRRNERGELDNGRNYLLTGDYKGFDTWAKQQDLLDEAGLHELKRSYMREDRIDNRAQAALALQQQAAANNQTTFNQEQDKFKRSQLMGRMILEGSREARSQEAGTYAAIQNTAKTLGIEVGEDGVPIFQAGPIGDSSKRLFVQKLKEQGIDPLSESERVNGLTNRLMDHPGMEGATFDEINAGRTLLEQGLTSFNDLSTPDKARLQAQQEAITADMKIAKEKRNEEFLRNSAKNPFMNPSQNVEKDLADIMGVVSESRDFFGWNDTQRGLLGDKARQALEDGYSPDAVRNMVEQTSTMGTFWGDSDENFDDVLKGFLGEKDVKGLKVDADFARTQHQLNQADLDATLAKRLKEAERKSRKSAGLTPTSTNELLRLLNGNGSKK